MMSKERFRTAIAFREPDRVPVDFWAMSEVIAALVAHLGLSSKEELLTHFDVDFRVIRGPRYVGPPLETDNEGVEKDIWGVPRKSQTIDTRYGKASYKEVVSYPMAHVKTVEELDAYPWPQVEWFDFAEVAEQCRRCGDKVAVARGGRLNRTAQLKPAMYLRGVEQILVDIALEPALARALFDRIAQFYLDFDRALFEAAEGGIDLFMMGDDFGMQNGTLVSPQMWREMLKPNFKRFIDLAHGFDIPVMHHTCGSVRALMDEFIECGLDVLQSLQPEAAKMDFAEIKREFGSQLAFQGAISIQKTLPYGSPEEVRAEVRQRTRTLGPGGGYILCTAHNIQPDTPLENVLALFEAYREFGRYPV